LLDHFLIAGSLTYAPLKLGALNGIPQWISRIIRDEMVPAGGNALTAPELQG